MATFFGGGTNRVNYQNVSVLVEPAKYLKQFNWDGAKYPTKQPLRNLAEIISKVHSYCILLKLN